MKFELSFYILILFDENLVKDLKANRFKQWFKS